MDTMTVLVWAPVQQDTDNTDDIHTRLREAAALGVALPTFELRGTTTGPRPPTAPADVIIVATPDLGEQACEAVEAILRCRPDTPIVVLAERGDSAQANLLLDAGATLCLLRRELGGSLLAHALVQAVERETGTHRAAPPDSAPSRPRTHISVHDLPTACLQSLLELLPDPVAFVDPDGIVRMCNQATAELYGREHPEELIDRNAFCLIAPEHRDLARRNLKRVLDGDRLRTMPYHGLKADGTPIFVEIRAKVLRDAHETPLGFLGSVRDVTAFRRVEQALAWSRADYQRLVENTSDLVAELDPEGRFLYANPQHMAVLGYEAEELRGVDARTLMHPEDLAFAEGRYQRLSETGEKTINELRFRHHNGTWRWLESTGRSFKTPTGDVRTVVISRDITERKQAERELRAALKDRTILLQEIHHRVKNNLGVVAGLLGLQALSVEDPQAQRALRESRRRVEAMARVHRHLYRRPSFTSSACLQCGTLTNAATVDMAAYVEGLTRDLQMSLGVEGVELKVEATSVKLDIDKAIPCALVLNELVTNAFRHGLEAWHDTSCAAVPPTATPCVKVSVRADDGTVEMVVSDNGRPLPSNFDLTSCESLGLSLVKLLAQQLGGELSVAREPQVAFCLRFPLTVAGDHCNNEGSEP